jgi:hypothetical protein
MAAPCPSTSDCHGACADGVFSALSRPGSAGRPVSRDKSRSLRQHARRACRDCRHSPSRRAAVERFRARRRRAEALHHEKRKSRSEVGRSRPRRFRPVREAVRRRCGARAPTRSIWLRRARAVKPSRSGLDQEECAVSLRSVRLRTKCTYHFGGTKVRNQTAVFKRPPIEVATSAGA